MRFTQASVKKAKNVKNIIKMTFAGESLLWHVSDRESSSSARAQASLLHGYDADSFQIYIIQTVECCRSQKNYVCSRWEQLVENIERNEMFNRYIYVLTDLIVIRIQFSSFWNVLASCESCRQKTLHQLAVHQKETEKKLGEGEPILCHAAHLVFGQIESCEEKSFVDRENCFVAGENSLCPQPRNVPKDFFFSLVILSQNVGLRYFFLLSIRVKRRNSYFCWDPTENFRTGDNAWTEVEPLQSSLQQSKLAFFWLWKFAEDWNTTKICWWQRIWVYKGRGQSLGFPQSRTNIMTGLKFSHAYWVAWANARGLFACRTR